MGTGDSKYPIDVDLGEGQSGDESPHSKVSQSQFTVRVLQLTGERQIWGAPSSRSFGLEGDQPHVGTEREPNQNTGENYAV